MGGLLGLKPPKGFGLSCDGVLGAGQEQNHLGGLTGALLGQVPQERGWESLRHHRVSFPTGVGGLLGLKPPKGFGPSCGVARGNECGGERMVG